MDFVPALGTLIVTMAGEQVNARRPADRFVAFRRWSHNFVARQRLFRHPGVSRQAHIFGASRIVLGRNVRIHPHATIDCRWDPYLGDGDLGASHVEIGDGTTICSNAMLLAYGGRIALGRNCTVNPLTVLYGQGGLTIGDNTRIACHTVIVPAQHLYADPDVPIVEQGLAFSGVTIGDDVWIGANVTILDGVELGKGCVVAAQSVVTKSFASASVVAGVPARVIKERK